MKPIKKITGLIIIMTVCFSTATAAHASGFAFNWTPLVADPYLTSQKAGKQPALKDLTVSHSSEIAVAENAKEKMSLFEDQNNPAKYRQEKKSVLDNIKIDFFSVDEFLPNKHERYSNGNDEQMSKLMDAVKSIINDDSKVRSWETIGQIIEPRINFYFEF